MSANDPQAEALINAGMRDLLTLRLLVETKRAPHEAIGFHAQQASEKFIKAVLVLHGVVFDRTHDLIVLYDLCDRLDVRIPVEKEKLRALNSYAVQFRYEAFPIEMVPAGECEQLATALASWAEAQLHKT